MRTVAIVAARVASQRLPGKVLAEIMGRSVVSHLLVRLTRSQTLDHLLVATGDDPANDPLITLCQREGWDYFVGSESNVLGRLYQAGRYANADAIVRVTGDCPLNDGSEVDRVVRFCHQHRYQYASNGHPPRLPDGLDTEVIAMQALAWLALEATSGTDCEHTTPLLRRRLARFWWGSIGHDPDLSRYRLCVDEPNDLVFLRSVMEILGADCNWRQVVDLLERQPELGVNQDIGRNAAYLAQLAKEERA